MDKTHRLRVLIANQRADRLELLARVVGGLGHDVIAREIRVTQVAAVTARERPDVALVGLGESSEHALQLITEIVRGAFCPVIALLEAYDSEWIDQAAHEASTPTSSTAGRRSCRARSISPSAALPNSRACMVRSSCDGRTVARGRASLARRRQLLEIHDGVVQQLAIAQMSLELNRPDATRVTLVAALENARAIVSRSLDELRGEGVPLDELLKDAASVK